MFGIKSCDAFLHRKRPFYNDGFSLIELSIAMIILSLILLPLISLANAQRQTRMIEDTMGFQSDVKDAIDTFYVANKRYPCPARLTLGPNDPDYGKEVCSGLPAAGSCANGVCRSAGDSGRRLVTGAVPFVDLKIAETRTYDRWSTKFSYTVTEDMTNETTFPAPIVVGTELVINGAIRAEQYVDDRTLGTNTLEPVADLQHYVLVSHGPNGQGGYTREGVLRTACIIGANEDAKNCDNNATFLLSNYGASRSMTEGNSRYYDDLTLNVSNIKGGIWRETVTTPDDIVNTNPGGVGIGTDDPEYDLDVNGNILATQFAVEELCDADGDDCFSPEVIAGDIGKIMCPTDGGVVTRIANVSVNCGAAVPVSGQVCPTGQYVIGMSGGTLTCGSL